MPYETANVEVEFAQYTIIAGQDETCTEQGILWHPEDSEDNCCKDVFGTPTDNVTVPAKGHKWKSAVDYTVYVDKEKEVEKKGTAYIESVKKTGVNQLSFVSGPKGAKIMRAGVVVNTTEKLNADNLGAKDLTIDNTRFESYDSTACQSYSSFKYTFTVGNLSEENTF